MARLVAKLDYNDLINKPAVHNASDTLPMNGGQLTAGTYSTIAVDNKGLIGSVNNLKNTVIIGENDKSKLKVYIVEPWQSNNPIKVKDDLWVSLEKDLISFNEIKNEIFDKILDIFPELVIKAGLNPENMSLVKSEVTLEVNKS